jgi:ankyrin repeat protein
MVFNHPRCFRMLCLTDGDKVAERDEASKRPAIVEAARIGDTCALREMLTGAGSNSNRIAKLGLASVADAAGTRLERVVNVNDLGSSGMTAAMWAARNGHVDALKGTTLTWLGK